MLKDIMNDCDPWAPPSRPLLRTRLHTHVDTPHLAPRFPHPSCTGPPWSHLEAEQVPGRVPWEGTGCLEGALG